MPPALVQRIHDDTARILVLPDVKKVLEQEGAQPGGGSPDEFRRFIQSERAVALMRALFGIQEVKDVRSLRALYRKRR